jgi:acyl CoA:acetate/3-ketoacid CoA transferase alpha subunit
MVNKVISFAQLAVKSIRDGARIFCGSFTSIDFVNERLEAVHAQSTRNLTLIANNPQVTERDGRACTEVK